MSDLKEIKVEDIRKGQIIRWESGKHEGVYAAEYRAAVDADSNYLEGGTFFLLEDVSHVLPTEVGAYTGNGYMLILTVDGWRLLMPARMEIMPLRNDQVLNYAPLSRLIPETAG